MPFSAPNASGAPSAQELGHFPAREGHCEDKIRGFGEPLIFFMYICTAVPIGVRICDPIFCTAMFNLFRKKKPYFAHPTAVIDSGAQIAQGCRIWHFSHIMDGAQLGENCNIGQNVVISPQVTLGRNCKVQNNVSVYTGVTCGDDVFLGPSCVFTNVINPRSAVNRKSEYMKTHVGNGASIGANATIVCGHNIGEYAFIGAGAVVVEDIPPYALVVGNPSRQIGWMSPSGAKLEFVQESDGRMVAQCSLSGEKFELKDNRVTKIK